MKKVMYLSMIFMFAAFTLNATTLEEKKEDVKVSKIVKVEKIAEVVIDGKRFTRYRGTCLDGSTTTFEADSREEAQAYINGYCRGLRDADQDQ